MEISMEDIVMKLIVNAGQARTKAIQALREARACKFEKAEELMKEKAAVVCFDILNGINKNIQAI